jgi:hypothetical protein
MKKTLLLSIGILGWLAQHASAQISLYTTANDFGLFNSGAGVVSTSYYSDSSTVNGIGNTVNPGGVDGIGSLQLTATGGWSGWLAGSDFPGPTAASFAAIAPGSTRPWSAESGWGPGTFVAYSGIITFDLYGGNFTDWNWWGINFNYDSYWGPFWAATSSNFTGADGQTWTHFEVPYSINATAGVTYFAMALAQNAGAIAGQTFYVDNFQVTVVPEPGTFALLGLGLTGFLLRRHRLA